MQGRGDRACQPVGKRVLAAGWSSVLDRKITIVHYPKLFDTLLFVYAAKTSFSVKTCALLCLIMHRHRIGFHFFFKGIAEAWTHQGCQYLYSIGLSVLSLTRSYLEKWLYNIHLNKKKRGREGKERKWERNISEMRCSHFFDMCSPPGICRTERPSMNYPSPWRTCRGRLGERRRGDTVQKSWLKRLFLLHPCHKHPACDQDVFL